MLIGIDGGGTKTEFVCIDQDGGTRARSRTSTTYHLQVGVEGVERALADGVGAICAELGIEPSDIAFTFVGLPAFGEDAAVDPQLVAACARLLGTDRFECGNDMVCGWAGSLACEDGINLVAGTGSIAYGRRLGCEARSGGWGELFGDEGSAYWIAVQGLNAFTRMSDGRLPKGPLHSAIADALALSSDLDLCGVTLGDKGLGRDGIAGLAPIVSLAAGRGDDVAAAILERAAEELGRMAAALRSALSYAPDERARISWSGGVLWSSDVVRNALCDRLRRDGGFDIVEPRWSPAEGAAHYARLLALASAADRA